MIPIDGPLLAGGAPAIDTPCATDDLSVPASVLVDSKGVVADILPGWSETTRTRSQAPAAS